MPARVFVCWSAAIPGWAGILAVLVPLAWPQPALGQGAPIIRCADGTCADPREPNYLACGAAGAYLFGSAGNDPIAGFGAAGDRCSAGEFVEEPARHLTSPDPPPAADWVPCADGACLDDAAGAIPGAWVAEIDWNKLHGWAVAETVRAASGTAVPVRLFNLELPEVPAIAELEEIGDAHILAQLCHVAAAAQDGFAPAAINLSFGRTVADPPACGDGERALACEIDRVVAVLHARYGTTTFAAAGNHQRLHFPASAASVIAVGNLDLTAFWPEGVVSPDPHTASTVRALMAGSGIVLEENNGPGRWGAPSGSSFASALLAGWVASRPEVGPLLQPGSLIDLVPLPEGGFALRLDGVVVRSSRSAAIDRLVSVALGLEDTGLVPPAGLVFGRALVPLGSPPPSLPSLSEINGSEARPSPDTDPCVPCVFARPRRRTSVPQATLMLGLSGALPPDSTLLAVQLEVDGAFYGLADENDPVLLQELELGGVSEIDLAWLPALPRRSLSLRFVLERTADAVRYWDAAPVLVRLDQYQRQHADDFETGDLRFWPALSP